jgi:hypothetical protein
MEIHNFDWLKSKNSIAIAVFSTAQRITYEKDD